ncbi:YtxH domain-containing protein [Sporolactobacillus putidus]|uniref:YtxH-like protein n=1 Tax=Sporolactobacillus putidus TaxID=492735 RepID=A0A917VXX0_9BACL|nr:YtxH domain-containing protein [Sporolactobacillus putidus]GGL42386.1 hypothetical protein GCM10007968_02870 [Sporolactobacillus putidus]
MSGSTERLGRGLSFLSGVFLGGILGAAAMFFVASPSGKKILQNIGQETISLKGKGSEFLKLAKNKSVSLKRSVPRDGKDGMGENSQMIPIPRDYV